jgi:hypothetical protein
VEVERYLRYILFAAICAHHLAGSSRGHSEADRHYYYFQKKNLDLDQIDAKVWFELF